MVSHRLRHSGKVSSCVLARLVCLTQPSSYRKSTEGASDGKEESLGRIEMEGSSDGKEESLGRIDMEGSSDGTTVGNDDLTSRRLNCPSFFRSATEESSVVVVVPPPPRTASEETDLTVKTA